MEIDPDGRYPNGAAFADALQGYLNSRVQERPSRTIRLMGTVVGVGVIVGSTLVALPISSSISSFAQQGWAAYSYVAFTVLSSVLAAFDWRTKGRNHLSPFIFAFAFITLFLGIGGSMAGVCMVAENAAGQAGAARSDAVLGGTWELAGNLPIATSMATIQLALWALVERA